MVPSQGSDFLGESLIKQPKYYFRDHDGKFSLSAIRHAVKARILHWARRFSARELSGRRSSLPKPVGGARPAAAARAGCYSRCAVPHRMLTSGGCVKYGSANDRQNGQAAGTMDCGCTSRAGIRTRDLPVASDRLNPLHCLLPDQCFTLPAVFTLTWCC
jgi:hypothetical protein